MQACPGGSEDCKKLPGFAAKHDEDRGQHLAAGRPAAHTSTWVERCKAPAAAATAACLRCSLAPAWTEKSFSEFAFPSSCATSAKELPHEDVTGASSGL